MENKTEYNNKKLIAFGDVNVDLITEIPRVQTAKDVRSHPEAQLQGGGTIGNTAAGTSRLGIDTVFLGKVGLDGYGRFLKDLFIKDGVDTSFLIEDINHFTVMVLAFIDASGDKHNVTFPKEGGAHFNISLSEIDGQIWRGCGWFHTSGISLGEDPCRTTTLELMKTARSKGITVSFDLNLRLEYFGWRPHVRESVLEAMALSDVVFASTDEELLPITGKTGADAAIARLSELYPAGRPYLTPSRQIIISRNGSAPALVSDHDSSFLSPGFRVNVIDALGAGDAFNAGFIAARLQGLDTEESLTWAHATAGFNLTQRGARGMPSRNELEQFIATHQRC